VIFILIIERVKQINITQVPRRPVGKIPQELIVKRIMKTNLMNCQNEDADNKFS
jgi:hypothetical protein